RSGPVDREHTAVRARERVATERGGLSLWAQDWSARRLPELRRPDTPQSCTRWQPGVQVGHEEIGIERRHEGQGDPLTAADETQVVMEDCDAHGPGGMGRATIKRDASRRSCNPKRYSRVERIRCRTP